MASNIEIKAVVDEPAALGERVAAIATDGPYVIEQHDTFFRCSNGRLKLRRFGDGSGELIFYRRADSTGPAFCQYERTAAADPDGLLRVLQQANGVRGEVIKTRTLYLAGRTRIHMDAVEGLGDFMELEVVLGEGESTVQGELDAERLMAALGVTQSDLIERAYIDLIEARNAG